MKKYILSLDQGTGSSRAILFDQNENCIAVEQVEYNQYYPQSGWVEHNPNDLYNSLINSAKTLLKKNKIPANEIASIGITNQRETTIVWNKTTGEPIYNAIVWQDTRTNQYCEKLKNGHYFDSIKRKTGLIIDSYFSATKIRWILHNIPEARKQLESNNLLFGTVDTWILWKLTKGKSHYTDYSNASRTMLYDIHKLKWSSELTALFEIPKEILPEVKPSSSKFGTTSEFGAEIEICSLVGDQQAALFGQRCFQTGMAKNTYGTGCFLLMNTGEKIVNSETGLLTTIAWGLNGKVTYALEGAIFIAGAAVKWLRDEIKLINNVNETEAIALEAKHNNGVYFVPAFSGLGAPYWNMKAKGAISGITASTNSKHIVRATLESIAYQTYDILDIMSDDSNIEILDLKVDGGATQNNFLMQFQADVLNKKVYRAKNIESTALGAALLAGIGCGFWKYHELSNTQQLDRVFEPKISINNRNELLLGWFNAIKSVNKN